MAVTLNNRAGTSEGFCEGLGPRYTTHQSRHSVRRYLILKEAAVLIEATIIRQSSALSVTIATVFSGESCIHPNRRARAVTHPSLGHWVSGPFSQVHYTADNSQRTTDNLRLPVSCLTTPASVPRFYVSCQLAVVRCVMNLAKRPSDPI